MNATTAEELVDQAVGGSDQASAPTFSLELTQDQKDIRDVASREVQRLVG